MKVLSITGGKGGIGKTTLSINLSVALAKLQKKIILFDADLGLANVDLLLGLKPKKNLHDVLTGTASLKDICLKGPHGIQIIPSASGIEKMADLDLHESVTLIHRFAELTDNCDLMIADMAAGISKQNIHFTHAAQDILIVICNEPASLMDSYAVIKILHQRYARSRFGIVVNKVKHQQEGADVFNSFHEATSRFLNISMQYLGCIPQDDYILHAVRQHDAVVSRFPFCEASRAFTGMAELILTWLEETTLSGGIHYFFEKLVQDKTQLGGSLCEG